jgi:IS30 family transposase
VHSERIKWRASIHDRPAVIENRHEFGNWEADSVLGLRVTGGLHTKVERGSRKLFAIKIESITAQATLEARLTIFASPSRPRWKIGDS